MNEQLLELAKRIEDELCEVEQAVERAQEGWRRFQNSADPLYMDISALNLHSFYNGIERIFEAISTTADNRRPQGINWHQILLEQMATELPGVRPAVISENSCETLNNYRGFRHVVRHSYASQLDGAKLQKLMDTIPHTLEQVSLELKTFAAFLKTQV